MTHQSENNKKLKDFFGKEYQSLKVFVNSRIKATASRDAEDIIQDVALKLFAGADRYSPINNVAGFVYNSIKNKIIDVMRSKKYNYSYENNAEIKLQELAEMVYDTAENPYSEEMNYVLKKAIINLKPEYRDIIIAIDFEGYSYKEISLETGIPKGTLMSRRHRAIGILYKKLETKNIN
ncbi:RNA polymerase sigma factor [Flavobacteriaceae bacterium S0825]|uniref:RNA polymerase sigma factor n=1 Tax=Gaetbulibacter sp. S0825 TaxID=2720084 RepID=UPI001431849A|nr:RNA polymerase sigma factor [Gaetbulibacter sp. S0825]MCK0109811.1 RNA polymerase sigma factor [Flavobacteriaceae bacterium S0825]NIX65440.1 RNA polymerase sigma factor [Gaetbulibacter sp. S0825]